MKTEKEIDADIFAIMAKIKTEFPELLKYISEMPVTVLYAQQSSGVSAEGLADYYNSLVNLVEKYATEQVQMAKLNIKTID